MLGRELAAAGVTVVSGMALGVDSAAHAGALDGGGATVAVLAGSAHRPYPSSKRRLHRAIVGAGCVVSELPPGAAVRKWSFPARNRIIAGLAQATVVVEASVTSGSLITADCARACSAATSARCRARSRRRWPAGPTTCSSTARWWCAARPTSSTSCSARACARPVRQRDGSELRPSLRTLLRLVESGRATLGAIVAGGSDAGSALVGLAELELLGYVRRGPAGSYVRVP